MAYLRDLSERKRGEQRQAAQHSVTQGLAESETLAEASPKILQTICESLAWQVGAIWKVDAAPKAVHVIDVWRSPQAGAAAAFEALTRETVLASGIASPAASGPAAILTGLKM